VIGSTVGLDELGTSKEVIVSTISNKGELLHEINLSKTDHHDSWPMLAA
jgi:hypothetical protein